MQKKLITIIGPMYNEETLVAQYCEETLKVLSAVRGRYDLELLLVDDGSKDGTLVRMTQMQEKYPGVITLVQLSRNFGLEGAIHAGLQLAMGDAVVAMDADLQDPPSVILEMIKEWERGADVVVGSRVGRPNDGFFKRWSAKGFYHLLDSMSGKLRLEKEAANFRLMDRKAVKFLLSLPEVNRVFRVVVPFLGMETRVVHYERDKRYSGSTKYRVSDMFRYALDSLTAISIDPLRKVSLAVLLTFGLFLLCLTGAIFAPSDWKPALTLGSIVCLLFLVLFAVVAVLAEYLGQVYVEVKGRPTSLVYRYIPRIGPDLGGSE